MGVRPSEGEGAAVGTVMISIGTALTPKSTDMK